MSISQFPKALIPVWVAELAVKVFQLNLGSTGAPPDFHYVPFAVSVVLLPLFAGFRISRLCGSLATSAISGVSVSLISVFVVGVNFLVTSAGWQAFVGYVISVSMFAVIPQALFGGIGGVVGRKGYVAET